MESILRPPSVRRAPSSSAVIRTGPFGEVNSKVGSAYADEGTVDTATISPAGGTSVTRASNQMVTLRTPRLWTTLGTLASRLGRGQAGLTTPRGPSARGR